jgi:decaprenylphospho-beta-D-ribofuranose 2-oxidase
MNRGTMKLLAGWGNYPVQRCPVHRPATSSRLAELVASMDGSDLIARGLGRSYGDAALNARGGVIEQAQFACLRSFDPETGLLECEAGISLAKISEIFLPRGWWLPTTPGTQYVTLGGAVAADVHGKNHHHDGSLGMFIEGLSLLTASGEVIECSRESRPEVFWATIGGMGLTGIILAAKLRLRRVETAFVDVRYHRTRDLDETLETFAAEDRKYRYSVAWIDCLARDASLGRSVIMLANDASVDQLPAKLKPRPLALPKRRPLNVPCYLPGWTLNSLSVKAFNELYYRSHPDGQAIVDYGMFFYPLDHIAHWNRIYGRRGFVQYQALFPVATARRGLVELLEAVADGQRGSFLAVLKSSGAANPGLLSYLYTGQTLALDLVHSPELPRLLKRLDEIVLRHSGRLYLAKDATMGAETFAAMYPRLEEFKRIKAMLDPNQRFVSSQARRVGIVESE